MGLSYKKVLVNLVVGSEDCQPVDLKGPPEVGGEGTDAFKEGRVAARRCLGIRSLLAFV